MKQSKMYFFFYFLLSLTSFSRIAHSDDLSEAAQKINSEIKQHPEWNFHSLLVSRNDHLIVEEYYSGSDEKWSKSIGTISFSRETLHDLRSVTKSVVSALVGIALTEGKLKSVDQPLSDFFPEYNFRDKKSLITLRHMLTMTSGLEWDELSTLYSDPKNDSSRILLASDPIQFVLSRPVISPPGETFNYSGGSTEVLGEILQRATHSSIRKYFEDKLWLPLGGQLNQYEWGGRKDGTAAAEFGLRMRPLDMIKFGSLYVNQGKQDGKQIIPTQWTADATQSQVKAFTGNLAKRFSGYGYQWWLGKLNRIEEKRVPVAIGNGGQFIMLFPEKKMVFVVTAGRYDKGPSTVFPMLIEKYITPLMAR